MDSTNENVIEWITGDKTIGVTLSQKKFVNKIQKYAKDHPGEIDVINNTDGSLFVTLPLSWLKLSPPRKVTDEQREAAAARLAEARANK